MSSNLALSGISGYDFSGITEMMIANYSRPLNTMQQKLDTLEVKKNAWQNLNTRLSALENTLADLKKTSTWTGTSAISSNTAILTATSNSTTLQGTYNVIVNNLASAQTVASVEQGLETASSPTSLSAGIFQITVGDKTVDIEVSDGASLKDIANSINNSGVGVNASVVRVDGGYKLALVSAKTGTENAAAFTDLTGNVLETLGVIDSLGTMNIVQPAQDANLEINGIEVTSSSNTVTTAIDGLSLTLNEEASGTTVRVTVASDYTKTQETVQEFVDQYNSLMTLLEKDLAYNQDSGSKGALYADPAVKSIQSRLRMMVSSSMGYTESTFKLLADIGISTSGDNFGKSAILSFDATKFTEALKEDAGSVANLFGAAAGGVKPITESTDTEKAQGLANILGEYLDPYLQYGGVLDSTENSYTNQIYDIKDKMEDFQKRIETYRERTTLKFAALESQLSALSSQSAYMSSIFSSLSSSIDKE